MKYYKVIGILVILFGFNTCMRSNSEMKVKDIISNKPNLKLFNVINDNSDNPINWKIKPLEDSLITDSYSHCIVRAVMIDSDKKTKDCLINLSIPERITDFVIFNTSNKIEIKYIYELNDIDVVPIIASEIFGSYELYYSKNNPEIGIQVLKQGLENSINPSVIAEDLGYILRDEKRYIESINAFLISEENGVSSEYIYQEIRDLYLQIANKEKADIYSRKLKDFGI